MDKEMLTESYSKYKVVIYPIVIGFASLTLIILVILPQLRGYFNIREEGELTQNSLRILELKAEELEGIHDGDLKRKVLSAIVALPSEKDYTYIIGSLQKLAAEAGLSLESVTLNAGNAQDVGGVSSFSVKLQVSSPKLSFDEFLKKIENSPSVLKVGSLSVNKTADDSLAASVIIDVFYSPTPKALGSVDSPLPKLTPEEEVLAQELESSIAITPATSTISEQPANLLPRGKANPFE